MRGGGRDGGGETVAESLRSDSDNLHLGQMYSVVPYFHLL